MICIFILMQNNNSTYCCKNTLFFQQCYKNVFFLFIMSIYSTNKNDRYHTKSQFISSDSKSPVNFLPVVSQLLYLNYYTLFSIDQRLNSFYRL